MFKRHPGTSRECGEAAIVGYLAEELLSPEAIDIAKREYRETILEGLEMRERENKVDPDTLRAEESKLREMLKAGTLSPDVAQAALDALAAKRRKAASIARMSPVSALESFALAAERYTEAVRNLGDHISSSEHSTEERELVRDLLGGHGTVFRTYGRVGARFEAAGLLYAAESSYKSMSYNIGSGGMIRDYNGTHRGTTPRNSIRAAHRKFHLSARASCSSRRLARHRGHSRQLVPMLRSQEARAA